MCSLMDKQHWKREGIEEAAKAKIHNSLKAALKKCPTEMDVAYMDTDFKNSLIYMMD